MCVCVCVCVVCVCVGVCVCGCVCVCVCVCACLCAVITVPNCEQWTIVVCFLSVSSQTWLLLCADLLNTLLPVHCFLYTQVHDNKLTSLPAAIGGLECLVKLLVR